MATINEKTILRCPERLANEVEAPQNISFTININECECYYESDGPMSPICNLQKSIQRIFCDDDDDVDCVINSFENVYLERSDDILEEKESYFHETSYNRLNDLPDDIYMLILTYLPRYVPNVDEYFYANHGVTSTNIPTITAINQVYLNLCNTYPMDKCLVLRNRFFHLNYVTIEDFMFNNVLEFEREWFTRIFDVSIIRVVLEEEIQNFKFTQFRVQCEETTQVQVQCESFDQYSAYPKYDYTRKPYYIRTRRCKNHFGDIVAIYHKCNKKQSILQCKKYMQGKSKKQITPKFDLYRDILRYKDYINDDFYGNFSDISSAIYGEFDVPHFKVQANELPKVEYKNAFFQNYFMPQFNANLQQQVDNLDADYIPKLFDDILTFMQMSTQSIEGWSRYQTIFQAVRIFIKCRYNESSAKTFSTRVLPFVKNLFDSMKPQADFFETSRGFLNSYKNINESPIVVKLYKCCLFLMSMSIFDKFGLTFETIGYSKLEEVAMKKKMYKKTDFVYVICDTILFILERGYQVYLTGDISCLFHSGGTYKDIYDECRLLQRQQALLCNPEANGFTESDFRGRLDAVIEKLTNIDKHSFRLEKSDIKVVKLTLNDMLMIRDDLNTKAAARSNRKAPMGLLIFGDSGIGKTTITSILCTYFAKNQKLPCGDEFRYTVNPAAKFWNGFLTSQHTVILDDVANEDPSLGDPKSLNMIIQVMNNQAFCPDQASLELKGTTPFKGKLVIATTNVKTLNAYHYFSCPSAVQRRFPFIITPVVKPEYKDERGMLNSCKVPTDTAYPDLWFFKVEIVKPVSISRGKHYADIEIIHEKLNMVELLTWFNSAIIKFNEDQNRVQECIKLMQDTNLCMCCSLPDNLCPLKPQGYMEITLISIIMLVLCYIIKTILRSTLFRRLQLCYAFYNSMERNMNTYNREKNNLIRSITTKQNWIDMGERMKNNLKQPKIFVPLITIVTFILTSYKTYKELMPQGDVSESVGSRPIEELNGRENVWYNNSLDLSPANFTRESSSSKSMEFTDFCTKIGQNVCSSKIFGMKNQKFRGGRLLCLGGHIYLANNHTIPDLSEGGSIEIILNESKGIGSNMTFDLSEHDVHRIPEKDLAFLTLRCLPPKKKIVQYFQRGSANGIFNGFYASKTKQGKFWLNSVKKIKLLPETTIKNTQYEIESRNNLWGGTCETPTIDGECGTPLIINSSFGYSIVGIHFLANEFAPNETYATNIDGDFVQEIYNSLTPFNVSSGDFSNISSSSKKREVTDLHKKSVFRYLQDGNANVYGSFTDFRGKSKSSVITTPMSGHLKKEDYKIKFAKPEMRSWVPWHIAAKDLVKPITKLDSGLLDACAQGYIEDVLSSIELSKVKDMLHPLDDFTAINGAQVAYIDKINRNTSAGNPWKMSKKFFMKTIPPLHGMLDPVEVDDEIMDRVDDIMSRYKNNEQAHPNFCAHLKDEPVSHKKAKIGKTRVFTGAPFDWTIVVRKYLLSFTRLVQNERLSFESAPGTIAQSIEWQEMYDYIVKHGSENIVAGDYKAFDKRMSPKEILLAFDIIICFLKLSGNYTEEDLQVVRCIGEDTAFALVEFNGDLIQLFGSNPSGNPLTVILNGLVNCIRMRYVYALLHPESKVDDFKQNVSLMTYGDDNIMSVNPKASWFNHTAIANKFLELDIVYTMADKEAESVPFININDASFLKRTWRHDEDLGCMVAPLDHESIEKMLMIWNRSKSVTEEAQGISVISTALREYFFYGRETFEIKLNMLKQLVIDLKWDLWVEDSTFPTFEELCMSFKQSSKHCDSFEVYFPVGTY